MQLEPSRSEGPYRGSEGPALTYMIRGTGFANGRILLSDHNTNQCESRTRHARGGSDLNSAQGGYLAVDVDDEVESDTSCDSLVAGIGSWPQATTHRATAVDHEQQQQQQRPDQAPQDKRHGYGRRNHRWKRRAPTDHTI